MNTNDNRRNAHDKIDHIFKELLPAQGMAERVEQITLSYRMLDAMLDGSIALCDAGTGIGKTFAYLAAGTVFQKFRETNGLGEQPILISTSSIALQNAVRDEYLPMLSSVLMEDDMIDQPIRAVIRKGKSHYVCDERLERRLRQVNPNKKNHLAYSALLALQSHLDIDEVVHLSSYDRERVCVPKICDCQRVDCRYLNFLEDCDTEWYQFQICNHNLLLADALHREKVRRPILPDSCAVILDEAHKLPDAARQMFGFSLSGDDIDALIQSLYRERYLLAAETLSGLFAPFLQALSMDGISMDEYIRLLIAPERGIRVILSKLRNSVTHSTRRSLEKISSAVSLFIDGASDMVFYKGKEMLCASISDLTQQLRSVLWNQCKPILLTSGTLAVGRDFRRFREESGLLTDQRVTESVSLSPFDYQKNCLLYLPMFPPAQHSAVYYEELAAEIAALIQAAWGHGLILFTSYAAMSAVTERLTAMQLPWAVLTLRRNALHTIQQFKDTPGSILLAAGAAWEGFDFPGDSVSLLIIPRLPFAQPDALKKNEQEKYPDLHSFIRAVVVPEMQIKLKQGFGRAIRTETDTCVVAILDERACPGQRYFQDVIAALPDMRLTDSIKDVADFIREVKDEPYFQEGRT